MELKGKKVLVTGADGFIGSHLAEELLQEGCQVKAFVLYNPLNSWGWLDVLPRQELDSIEVFAGDVRDPNGVRMAVKGVEVVFHLAALIAIPYSYRSPDMYIDTNVKGTLNVLQACREYAVERVIVTSTSEVYGTAQYVPMDERHPLQAQSPYSASKIGADRIAESFYRSFGIPVVIARPFNTYGLRQSARAVIPTIILQLLKGNGELRLGSLHPTRDFNYVLDVCKGLCALARCDEAIGREVNIGSGTEVSVSEVADLLKGLVGLDARIISEEKRKRPERSEVERLVCDNALMRRLTGWRPETPLRGGLSKTVEWFRDGENLKRYKGDIYNI